jgi:hypothetical protein
MLRWPYTFLYLLGNTYTPATSYVPIFISLDRMNTSRLPFGSHSTMPKMTRIQTA